MAGRRFEGDVVGAGRQLSAAGHRVAGVDDDVDDDLFELPLIDQNEAEVAVVHQSQLDSLADQAAQQVRQLGQHIGQHQDLGLQRLLAREGEQLTHQVGRAVGVLFDLHDVGEGLIARRMAQQQKIAKADHRRQQIVEVVRDAARQLANRLHLL